MARVSSKHPDWTDRSSEWAECRHAHRGANAVKAEGETYLPMPSGWKLEPDGGREYYASYIMRAQFPDVFAPTVRGMVGVIHRTEANIKIPRSMEGIWERATSDGLPLEALHRRITAELLTTGRYALMADAPATGADLPYFAGYSAEALINWSPERDLFVLDESGPVRDGFSWRHERRYRVLELVDGVYTVTVHSGDGDSDAGDPVTPRTRGGRNLEHIPLVVVGARDLHVQPDDPPLLGVARAALAEYRLDADYRHQLFMSGQETLVVVNGEAPTSVGAGTVIELRGGEGFQPDAKYVGPSGVGIDAHRQAKRDERENAVASGARIFGGDRQQEVRESTEARKLRYAAETATLTSIALASAQGLEAGLRNIAIMRGEDPEGVVVTPDLDHLQGGLSPQDAESLVRSWQQGAISYQTLYENLQRGEIASSERSAEDELALIDADEFRIRPGPAQPGDVLPGQPGRTTSA